jgi:uncharacterized protein YcnI
MRRSVGTAFAALLTCGVASPALTHVSLEVSQAPVGSIYKAVFRVPHGCEGHAATMRLTVRLPEGVTAARPMPKAGWRLTTVARGEAAASGHGAAPAEVAEVIWEGGPLEDAHYDEFVIRIRLPDQPGTLYIPVVQDCVGGGRAAWEQIPEPGSRPSNYPFIAPAVRVTPRN